MPAGQGPGRDHRQEERRPRQDGGGPEPAPGARPGEIEDRRDEDRQDGEALEEEPRREQRREAGQARGLGEARDQGDREHQQEGERRVEVAAARAVMAEKPEGGGRDQPGGQRGAPVEVAPAEGHGEGHGAKGEERRREAQGERRDAEEMEGERDQPVAQRRLQVPVLGHPGVGGDHQRAAPHHLVGRDPVARLVGVVDAGLAQPHERVEGGKEQHQQRAERVLPDGQAAEPGDEAGPPAASRKKSGRTDIGGGHRKRRASVPSEGRLPYIPYGFFTLYRR